MDQDEILNRFRSIIDRTATICRYPVGGRRDAEGVVHIIRCGSCSGCREFLRRSEAERNERGN